MKLSWDIFCTVIDNYGDIGVCWRLARQIARERAEPVRLWVDDLSAFALLEPCIQSNADKQCLGNVEVRHWTKHFPTTQPHQVVIEAFGCQLPAAFVESMLPVANQPVWINLEYLSAESWVEGCHRLTSTHPRLGLKQQFYYPGFTPATGGLLREPDLLDRCRMFQQNQLAQAAFLQTLGYRGNRSINLLISLFCYDNPALPDLLDAWACSDTPLTVLVAYGKAQQQVAHCLGSAMRVGQPICRGNLTLIALPFLSQDDYDQLLWVCDLNVVRGEDSFVRAQWAAKPMIWHIYQQEDDAHLVKLQAWLDRYLPDPATQPAIALRQLNMAWNTSAGASAAGAWHAVASHLSTLQHHAANWRASLSEQADLVTQLASFAQSHVNMKSD